jgi:hypothetical protein
MKRASSMATVLLLVLSSVAAGQRRRFNPDGSFWIIADAPKGFEDFGGINLNSHRNRRLPSSGINLTNGAVIRFRTLSIAREKFTFTTRVRHGISYRFSGRFLKGGTFFSEISDDEPVLEGTLTKLSNGRVVAQAQLRFSYFGGT